LKEMLKVATPLHLRNRAGDPNASM
jgi:hypothetical protein